MKKTMGKYSWKKPWVYIHEKNEKKNVGIYTGKNWKIYG